MAKQGLSAALIKNMLGVRFSQQSFHQWNQLYEETRCIIRDPDTYKAHGRPASLTQDESTFMIQLVQSKPGLFLDKIRERLYDASGVLLSIAGVHRTLVELFTITLKKPDAKNIQKSLTAKYAYVERMEFFPADFLVFTVLKDVYEEKYGTF
ncbi:uncharacterized protein PGTG_15333 [Puccinia graminis f. sp. tritici CRL 75-36-700-3]|uniref:Uncharacterized protein n=1 Tax=Puccinia graminis f. sp. tritici (strain CRL 75-36-700-3 / race SCCL) TaxID=418459 RepID=E3KYU5_PUCGT|nr:uncharacterized protein PGTG_15333 [Puccinia graminis f. sp. tritici CRL 75-36-700-3]EFP89491.2 hypothetical protein PGTG_15333 [Puccinia graminis f. sp. tritici CRL 75-36-700-3]